MRQLPPAPIAPRVTRLAPVLTFTPRMTPPSGCSSMWARPQSPWPKQHTQRTGLAREWPSGSLDSPSQQIRRQGAWRNQVARRRDLVKEDPKGYLRCLRYTKSYSLDPWGHHSAMSGSKLGYMLE